jgi:hypothetical protein
MRNIAVFSQLNPPQLCEVHMRKVLLIATVSLSTLFAAPTHAVPITPVGSQAISGSDLIEVMAGTGMVVVMVGGEVTAIAIGAGAVVGRSGGEVTTVRPVIGRRAGANPIPTGKA